ncbi:DUF3489 domain-containing protein [Roseomonas terrae]|uniref:DUF3489 domain-containing protein n=2 Tax=Neoroseomonas terrae TaxID=424799 RepID=A0ABS5ECK0_9PROT|nr:DUF3489 domain-containing protein [Neoroseomonas terrae]
MPDLPPAAASLSLPVEGQGDSHAASAPVPPATSDLGSEAHQQPPLSQHGRNGRAAALRPAAAAVVTAWNGSGRDGLDDAVTALRPAPAAAPHSRRDAAVLRQPRTGTKQQAILALLRRDEGATIAQIIEATGWQQHTVRGFLAGLKRRGITVEVLERVRQVGPSKQGAKGSYSIYRITAAAPVEAG